MSTGSLRMQLFLLQRELDNLLKQLEELKAKLIGAKKEVD